MKRLYILMTFLCWNLAYSQIVNPTSATTNLSANFSTHLEFVYNGTGLETFPSLSANHLSTTPLNSFIAVETTGYIDFDLGGIYDIDGIAFWNQNLGGPFTNMGVNSVTFLSSMDGVSYTEIPGAPTNFAEVMVGLAPPEVFNFTAVNAAFIRMVINSNHGGDNTGFAEIAFSAGEGLSTNTFSFGNHVKLFPNPSSDFIQISGLNKRLGYNIVNVLGAQVKIGSMNNNEQIDVRNFTQGLYVLKLDNGTVIKFIKNK
ncbi:MAG: T9SS type A sorting domain-containing protein [Flavobacteriaceae bacterium]|nr:T9SS type A sorting domain-containing protein [Flavobacteriaceae bacterium]